jgi:hypothetical protein
LAKSPGSAETLDPAVMSPYLTIKHDPPVVVVKKAREVAEMNAGPKPKDGEDRKQTGSALPHNHADTQAGEPSRARSTNQNH